MFLQKSAMEALGLGLLGLASIGIGSSVVLFTYNDKYGSKLKYNWYIIAQAFYVLSNVLCGASVYLVPFASTAIFIPIQILATIAVSRCILDKKYTYVQLALLVAICLMYVPIFMTGPAEMDHGNEGFLHQLETHLDSAVTIGFLGTFGFSLLVSATVVSMLTINTQYHTTLSIFAAAFIASIASAFLVIYKMSIEVIGRIIAQQPVSPAYYVAFGALPALGFLQLKLQGVFYSKLDIGIIYPLKVSFVLVLSWLESLCFFHESPQNELVFLISMLVQTLLLGLYIFVSPKTHHDQEDCEDFSNQNMLLEANMGKQEPMSKYHDGKQKLIDF